jgi:hypothetical protein
MLPHTPDGRYFVHTGSAGPRLWRATNPNLTAEERAQLTSELMEARREVRLNTDPQAIRSARARVHEAKAALGERGPVWWTDGAPDWNRRLIKNTPYAEWWAQRLSHCGNQRCGYCNMHPRSPGRQRKERGMFNLIAAAPAALLLLAGCSAPEGDEDDEDRNRAV